MERHLPDALGPPIYTRTCLYTLTPDRHFVVDRLPDAPGVAVVLGAAHGLQVRLGTRADRDRMQVDGGTPSAPEIGAFRIDRAVLAERS
jgi:sarcosine oxidase